jgi:simple sugar transport system permease protein
MDGRAGGVSPRVPFGPGFPDVVIQQPAGSPVRFSAHPDYAAARAGDKAAAERFVDAMVTVDKIEQIRRMIGDTQPIVVAPHAEEVTGRNAIPETYAHYLSDELGLSVDREIVQANRPRRTGQDGAYRRAARCAFDGDVEQGRDYLMVDDNVTQGGTLADLRSFIEQRGGNVVGASTLTGSRSSEILAPRAETIHQLRTRFPDLEAKWKTAFGHDFTGLTQSECTYLVRSKPADALGDRIIASRQAGSAPPPGRDAGGEDGGKGGDEGGGQGGGGVAPPSPASSASRPTTGGPRGGISGRFAMAVALSMCCAAALIALSGRNPLQAFAAIALGAVGSAHQIGAALNRTTPYLLSGLGVALCFRAGIINIGAEGQIAVGGMAAAAAALAWPIDQPAAAVTVALLAGALGGAAWAGLAAAMHIGRHVHEVLVTLLLNFVALLLVQQALAGPLGQFGAGFLQSPLLPRPAWLPHPFASLGAHPGFPIAMVAAALLSFVLWRTPFGFALRVAGASRPAAAYAGYSMPRLTWSVMLLAGGLAGLAGGIEVLGVHRRLIEGFSAGFGFKAVTVALLGALEPLAVVPAALFVGLLESGANAMQRQVGVPSAMVAVIEGLTMLFALAAMARRRLA